MSIYKIIESYSKDNQNKKIALFVDMDGTIASLDIDINNDIAKNTPGFFLNKKPLKKVIDTLDKVSKLPNIDMYILSACSFKDQANDKRKWLQTHAPFFKEEKLLFVIKEVVNYTKETKEMIKTENIVNTVKKNNYDLAIYIEDEYLMLRKAYARLKDKILCIHISNFLLEDL